jgi:hypothetical protein
LAESITDAALRVLDLFELDRPVRLSITASKPRRRI